MKKKKFNWNHCYIFYVLAQEKNISQAAKKLQLAPSTISEQISTLEEQLGKKLFVRSSKGLSLNSFGFHFFKHARRVFDEGEKLMDIFTEEATLDYPVNIAVESNPLISVSMRFLSQYSELYSAYGLISVHRKTSVEDIVRAIFEHEIDWGVSSRITKHRSIEYQLLGRYPLRFLYHKRLEDKFKTPHEILQNIPVIMPSNANLAKQIERHLNKFLLFPSQFIFSQYDDFSKILCHQGQAVWCLGPSNISGEQDLKTVDIGEVLNLPLYALWRKGLDDLSAIQGVQNIIAQHEYWGV